MNPPDLSTTRAEYNRFDAWIRKAQIDGVLAADLEFGAVGKLTRPKRILDLVELDHHQIDLIPILGKTPLGHMLSQAGLGRIWITIAFDIYSNYPLGIYPNFEGTGLLPALMCLSHAVQEKSYVSERFPHINGTLLAYGKPVKVRYDNAKEFIGYQIARALARVGIGFELARPKHPEDKPWIERFNGTLESDFISWLKGRTGSSAKKRGPRDPMKEAGIEIDDLVGLLHEYLITVYARRKQRWLDWDTPEQRWLNGLESFQPKLLTPEEQSQIDVLASIEVDVTARREGIRWNNKFYQSEELQQIRRFSGDYTVRKNKGTKLRGRVSLRNVGVMYVSVPGAKPPREIAVPCTKKEAHGRTFWQDEVIEALLRQKGRDPASGPEYGHGFNTLFKRSLGYMGVNLNDAKTKPVKARSAATAARFAGVLVDGVTQHALARVELDATRLDLFKEVSNALATQSINKQEVQEDTEAIPTPTWEVDEIDISLKD